MMLSAWSPTTFCSAGRAFLGAVSQVLSIRFGSTCVARQFFGLKRSSGSLALLVLLSFRCYLLPPTLHAEALGESEPILSPP